jgi:hypothetical protein
MRQLNQSIMSVAGQVMAIRKKASKDFRVVAANSSRLRLGDNDCGLTFILETDDHEGPVQIDEVQISLTPRALKLLNYTITKALGQFEELVGHIALPPEQLRIVDQQYEAAFASAKANLAKPKTN